MATEVGTYRTANELWANAVQRFGPLPVFRHKAPQGWVTTSYSEADQAAREIAAGMVAIGLGAGDRVCILAQSRPEWMLADIAIVMAGGASVPIYGSLLPEQCQFIAKDSGARLAIVEDAAQLEKLLPMAAGIAPLRIVHIAGDAKLEKPDDRGRKEIALADVLKNAGNAHDRIMSLEDLRGKGRAFLGEGSKAAQLAERGAANQPDSTFTIIYTSGTTGTPKGVVISHECLLAAIGSGVRALTIRHDDEQFLFLPLAHVFAREVAWAPFFVGCATSFGESLSKIKDNLVESRPTFLAGVPRIFEKFYAGVQASIAKNSSLKRKLVTWAFGVGRKNVLALRAGKPGGGFQVRLADKLVFAKLRVRLGLDRCRFMISGGAPLSPEIAEFFQVAGLLVLEGYGLTETMAAAFVNRIDRNRIGTVGPAIDVVSVNFAPDGEILLKGPSIFKQYFNNPEATAEAIDTEGWFHTGDIGELNDGLLRITDRKKDLIVTAGGKKIAPQPIENAIKASCPAVSQAMVFGDARPYCVALVTLSEAALASTGGDYARAAADADIRQQIQSAMDALNARLASFESIKKFAILPADFTEQTGELTPSLKIKRKVVLNKYGDAIAALYA